MPIMDTVTGLGHMGLPTADMDKTIAFYQDLGFDIAWEKDRKVVFLRKGGFTIETYLSPEAAQKPGAIEHIALEVGDIEAAWAIAVEKGYEICPPGEIKFLPFWENGTKFFTIMGPNAEKIEFCQQL